MQIRQPTRHIKQMNTRQVTQITYAAIYKHLGLLSVTLYSCVSTSPHHIFFHQMYANARRTILTLDQFTHILPQAVYCITTARYYFQGTTFISYWIFNTAITPQASSGQEWQFHIATVRAHIGTSTGRCPPTSSGRSTGLKICTYRFLCMPIAMYHVRTLCEKYFLSYDGFSWFLTGRFRHRVLKHGVGVEWDAGRTAA